MHATRPKNIQIEYSFFLDLISYAFMHEDSADPAYQRINTAFRRKLEAMERHYLYSLYKSGTTEDIRRKARKEYLEAIGLRDSFRWEDRKDANVVHNSTVLFPDFDADRGTNL